MKKKIFYILNTYIFLINNINLIVNRNLYNLFAYNTYQIETNVDNILLINNNIINKVIKKINNTLNFNSTLNRLNYIDTILNNLLNIINKYNNEFILSFNSKLIDNNKILDFIKLFEKNINSINKNIV